MTSDQDPEDTFRTQSETALSKLAESINQYSASALISLSVPEFHGSPGEDVREFLENFRLATITLTDDMKCLAIQKALRGSANIWARANLRSELERGDWTRTKAALIERFEGHDAGIKHLERLARMKFNSKTDTLLSYVEKYAAEYQLAHENPSESEVIRSFRMNLPREVQRGLNILNDKWPDMKNLKEFFMLARRVEENILAYDNQDHEETPIRAADLSRMLNEVREMLRPKEESPKETAVVAAIGNQSGTTTKQDNQYPYRPRNQHYEAPSWHYHSRDQGGTGNRPGRSAYHQNQLGTRNHFAKPHQRHYGFNRPLDKPAHYQQQPQAIEAAPTATESETGGTSKVTPTGKLADRYYKAFGMPPAPCNMCQGFHFHRHCPYRNLN